MTQKRDINVLAAHTPRGSSSCEQHGARHRLRRRHRRSRRMKLVWLVLTFALPFLGSLLWFAVGRRGSLYRDRAV
ncbi:PLD nuclease N-terminal domain-containing protein [Streptomyces sp. NPDC058284]|uniref:PLD nuclease N-terminal domain-containing protein n=1 Tax=unclassified Streptomyces TaxID=2593676 RepID=UPI003666977F